MNSVYPICACEGSVEYNAQQLASYGELAGNGKTFEEYLNGLTPSKKKVAMTALGLYLRDTFKRNSERQILNAYDVHKVMHPLLAGKKTEEFWALFLNTRQRVKAVRQLSGGGWACTIVDVRVVMKEALMHDSSAIIVCHNHPSGSLMPSRDDDNITDELVKAGKALKIKIFDHVIFTEGGYYSYQEHGKI